MHFTDSFHCSVRRDSSRNANRTYALTETNIPPDGLSYLNRALYIHHYGKLPPSMAQPVGFSIALSKLAFLGREGMLRSAIVIQQMLDFAVICTLVYFDWLLSLGFSSMTTRAAFLLLF